MSQPVSIVRPAVNAELVATLEHLLEEAKRGEFTALLAFRFGELPLTCAHTITGGISEELAVFAVERWKHDLLSGRA